jgi:hypothetical protein
MRLILAAAFLQFYSGCATRYEDGRTVSIQVFNDIDREIVRNRLCIENSQDCVEKPSLQARDSVLFELELPPGEGGFIYTGTLDSVALSKRFGYFSNGYSHVDLYRVRILSVDSILVE